jgi:hypothetical protein
MWPREDAASWSEPDSFAASVIAIDRSWLILKVRGRGEGDGQRETG